MNTRCTITQARDDLLHVAVCRPSRINKPEFIWRLADPVPGWPKQEDC